MDKILLGSVALQLLLTFVLMFCMGISRISSLKNKQVKFSEIALSTDAYPKKARQIANAFANQFQMPLIFYFGVVLSLVYGTVSSLEIILAYSFVALRYIHVFIHTTNNNLVWRLNIYFVGVLVLIAYLVAIFYRIIF
ncbi:MAG: MAPEG family protein [Devosiaceae bacterium]|nr:MAPEG family protein [Devosiaceae bacterium]